MALEFSMYVKNCKSGYPRYFGVTIDPVTGAEIRTEINGEEYVANGGTLGCPPSGRLAVLRPITRGGGSGSKFRNAIGDNIKQGIKHRPIITIGAGVAGYFVLPWVVNKFKKTPVTGGVKIAIGIGGALLAAGIVTGTNMLVATPAAPGTMEEIEVAETE